LLGFSETKRDKTLRLKALADFKKKAVIKAEMKIRKAEIA